MEQPTIYVNTRALRAPLTGVQRYTTELLSRLDGRVRRIAPGWRAQGPPGHAWEQLRLPTRLGGALLWSPANTGPLAVRRQVLTIHDLTPLDHPEWLNPAFARWYRFLWRRLAPRVRHIITVSEFSKQRIVEALGVPAERVAVIPNGVDDRFRPCPDAAIAEAKRALRLPAGRYLLSLCSLEPRKNLHRLLQAWAQALPSIPEDVSLVIGGGQGMKSVFGDFAIGRLPRRVVLTGHVEDRHLPPLLAGALGFVYPSVYEGFGLPVLEAMAVGTPTLAGNRTSLPEVAGDAGLLVDPLDVEALAHGLAQLATDEALRCCLRERGRARAKEFTWNRAAGEVWQVLVEASC